MDKDQQQKHLIDIAIRLLNEQYEENADFNTYFAGDEQITLGRLQFDKSRALFWLDREAYDAEKTEWENQTIQEQHNDTIELLRDREQIAPFRSMVEAVRRQRIVPFVGAGFSRPMGVPLWSEALQELHDRRLNLSIPEFSSLLRQGRYLEAAQILADHNATLTNNYIRTKFNIEEIKGPVLLLPHICNGCIVTTNFDAAIEEVFRQAEKSFDGYMHGTQQHNFFSRLVKGERCILKLHGDAADDPNTFVFTRRQYVEAYGEPFNFSRPLPKALRQIFISNSLLFLGCSLEKDWTLELFRAVRNTSEYEIPTHYAILPEPPGVGAKQLKESYLLEHGIESIWYPTDQHDYVEKLLLLAIDVAAGRIALHG